MSKSQFIDRADHLQQESALYFIVNPAASNGKARLVWTRLECFLEEEGIPYHYAISEDEDHLIVLAKQAAVNPGAIVAGVGGDGTLSLIATAIHNTDAVLGIIPAGTGNDFARTFAIPSDPTQSCRVLLEGKTIPLDLGRLNGKFFFNVVGAGLDAEVVADANRMFKRISGSLGYMFALLKQLMFFRPHGMSVTVDGQRFDTEAWLVTVANAKFYGGGMKVAPDADPQDGLAEVVIVGNLHRLQFIRLFPLVYRGNHVHHAAVRVLRGANISVECEQPLFVHADGDIVGKTPLTVSMHRHAICIKVPKLE